MRMVWLLIGAVLGWRALQRAARQPVVALRGRAVIISGEDFALRRAIAAAFAASGARVLIAEPDAPPEQVVRETLARFRRLDVLVNIAGRGPGGLAVDMDAAALRAAAEAGLYRVARLAQESLPVLVRQGRGHIVNVGSVAGGFPVPGLAVASGLGAGMAAFTDALRREVDDRGVRVSLVLAGEDGARGDLADPAPEAVASATVEAVRYGRRTVVAGGGAKEARLAAAQWLERLAPGLADLYWRWTLTPEVIARLDDRLTG